MAKRLKICKFKDEELQMMCGKKMEEERGQWKMILFQKEKEKSQPQYIEKVGKAKVTNDMHLTQILKKQIKLKLHKINEKLMEQIQEVRKAKGLLT